MALVLSEVTGPIGTITLNYTGKRNALSKALIDRMIAALHDASEKGLRVVVLRAASGVKVWSAGHDVEELPLSNRDPLGWDDPLRRLIRAIEDLPLPVIAMIEGSVWGGACEVAFACDVVVAAENSTFAITPAKWVSPTTSAG